MSDSDDLSHRAQSWLMPLAGDTGPCGPDLEYDNQFLALTQAATGKPESQFGPAEAPDWRQALETADALLERSRDLRVAIFWLRAQVHLAGYPGLVLGLQLVNGLVATLWDTLHPMPDADDGDAFARINAFATLRDPLGLLGDLRTMRVVDDRAIGEVNLRAIEIKSGLAPAHAGEVELNKEQLAQMVAAAVSKTPALRQNVQAASALMRQLASLALDKLGAADAPDLKPLQALLAAVAAQLPPEPVAQDDALVDSLPGEGDAARTASQGAGAFARGLSGSVSSRDDAIKAIDMVCVYLERAEPTNPAPLFLRRARQLIGHNFLQLMQVLAPDALAEVARAVGVDPESIEPPGGS